MCFTGYGAKCPPCWFCIAPRIFIVVPQTLLGAGSLPPVALCVSLPIPLNGPHFLCFYFQQVPPLNNHNKSLPLLLLAG